jgi:hypothetical protein
MSDRVADAVADAWYRASWGLNLSIDAGRAAGSGRQRADSSPDDWSVVHGFIAAQRG